MKPLSRFVLLLAFASVSLPAAEDALTAAMRAADDERIAATKTADPARLEAIFSDSLHYAHSSGKIEDKAAYVQSLTTRNTVYESFAYQTRDFRLAGPGIVLMTGRVTIHATSSGQKVINDLNFLAVWREEGGKWRFLAWQSCKNPPPVAKP